MTSILFVSHDVVGSAMAGTGIRVLELALALAAEHDVTLAAPGMIDHVPGNLRAWSYVPGDAASLAEAVASCDVIVANSHALEHHPELAHAPVPLVLDMYDPTPLENLVLLRNHDPLVRLQYQQHNVGVLVQQLYAADCFLCATERQRDMYFGSLLAAGRVSAALTDTDPALHSLLRVVPFGVQTAPPVPTPPPWPDFGPDAQVILWSGGIWDWMDPLTLVEAMVLVRDQVPQARLVMLAGQHPGNAYPMQMPLRARALAEERGVLGSTVVFLDRWLPYVERAGALLNAQIAVYLHEETLESNYAAVRSRFLDHLWAGLPSVVTGGDAAAALVAHHHLGRVVPPGDVAATAEALVALLRDKNERAMCAANARALAEAFSWPTVAKPLLDFCRAPRRAVDRPVRQDIAVITEHAAADAQQTKEEIDQRNQRITDLNRDAAEHDQPRNAALRDAAEHWQINEPATDDVVKDWLPRQMVDTAVRPFARLLIQQHNQFNAAVVRAFDALAESSDQRRSVVFDRIDRHELHTLARLRHAETSLRDADIRISRYESMLAALNTEVVQLRALVREFTNRLADHDEADTMLAQRIAELARQRASDDES